MRNIKLGYIGEIKNFKGNNEELLGLFDLNDYTVCNNVDLMQSHERVQRGRFVFLIFAKDKSRKIYKLLPLVENDNVFSWKELEIPTNRDRTQQLNAQVHCGALQFGVNYYTTDGHVRINIYYTGGKLKQLIDYINLYDGDFDNATILAEINKYVENFKNSTRYWNAIESDIA